MREVAVRRAGDGLARCCVGVTGDVPAGWLVADVVGPTASIDLDMAVGVVGVMP